MFGGFFCLNSAWVEEQFHRNHTHSKVCMELDDPLPNCGLGKGRLGRVGPWFMHVEVIYAMQGFAIRTLEPIFRLNDYD